MTVSSQELSLILHVFAAKEHALAKLVTSASFSPWYSSSSVCEGNTFWFEKYVSQGNLLREQGPCVLFKPEHGPTGGLQGSRSTLI